MVLRRKKKLPEIGANAKQASGINLVRKDYLLDERVVIASARAKRPEQFKKAPEKHSDAKNCPFCPQNQDKIIMIEEEPDPKGGWAFRSIVNLFAAVTPEHGVPKPRISSRMWEETHAYGFAEVVIDSPDHKIEMEEMPVERIASLLRFYAHRTCELRRKKGIRYVSLFKNRGAAAGASISHSHAQIIATHFLPGHVLELMEANFRYIQSNGKDPFEDILKKERNGPRFIAEDKNMAVITPFAAKLPFELWIVPKRHVTALSTLNAEEFTSLASMIKRALTQLDTLGKPAYNLLFIGDDEYGMLQFHVRLMPRINVQAGFELGTGTIINPVPPEDAAEFYRKGFE